MKRNCPFPKPSWWRLILVLFSRKQYFLPLNRLGCVHSFSFGAIVQSFTSGFRKPTAIPGHSSQIAYKSFVNSIIVAPLRGSMFHLNKTLKTFLSRGASLKEFQVSSSLWKSGPSWLSNRKEWPTWSVSQNQSVSNVNFDSARFP